MAVESRRVFWIGAELGTRFFLDARLLAVVLAIVSLGYVMVCSASLHKSTDLFLYPRHQLIHVVIGFVTCCAAATVPVSRWERHGNLLYLIGIVLLLAVLVPGIGKTANGSTRWLSLGVFDVQVSELAKFSSIVYIAGYISRRETFLRRSPIGVFFPLTAMLPVFVLLLVEPDLGAAAVVLATVVAMLFIAGARMTAVVVAVALLGGAAALLIATEPYRMARILAFLDPWKDPLGKGYQLIQAMVAFGRGEITGVGLGAGVQKLNYLPEAHTDFLFSVIGEELGLCGVTVVILLYSALVWRGFCIARRAELGKRPAAAFIAYGITVWFGVQAFVNMGVNTGLIPPKGLTLPLMSYGGGSLVVMSGALGVLFRIFSETVAKRDFTAAEQRWVSAS